MLHDKQIALDCLMSAKSDVVSLTQAVLECSNQNLRQTLIQMRNQAEQDQQEIYHIAERTGGYLSSAPADHQLINRVNSFYQQMGNQVFQSAPGFPAMSAENINQPFEQPVSQYARY